MLPSLTTSFVDSLHKTRHEMVNIAPTAEVMASVPTGEHAFNSNGSQLALATRMSFFSKENQYSLLKIPYGADLAKKRPEDLSSLISRFTYDDLEEAASDDELLNHFLMLLMKIEILLRYNSKRTFDSSDYYGRVFNAVIMLEGCLLSPFFDKLFALNIEYQTAIINNNFISLFLTLRENLLKQPKFQQTYFAPSIIRAADLKAYLAQFYVLIRTGRISVPLNPDTNSYDFIDFTLSNGCWPCRPKPPTHDIEYRVGSSRIEASDQANRQLWLFLQYCNPANKVLDFYTVYEALIKAISLFTIKKRVNAKTKPIICALATLYSHLKLYSEANVRRKNEYSKKINRTAELRCAEQAAGMPVSINARRRAFHVDESKKCLKHPEHRSNGVSFLVCEQHPDNMLMKCCAEQLAGIEIAHSKTWCDTCKSAATPRAARPATVFNPLWRQTRWQDEEANMETSEI